MSLLERMKQESPIVSPLPSYAGAEPTPLPQVIETPVVPLIERWKREQTDLGITTPPAYPEEEMMGKYLQQPGISPSVTGGLSLLQQYFQSTREQIPQEQEAEARRWATHLETEAQSPWDLLNISEALRNPDPETEAMFPSPSVREAVARLLEQRADDWMQRMDTGMIRPEYEPPGSYLYGAKSAPSTITPEAYEAFKEAGPQLAVKTLFEQTQRPKYAITSFLDSLFTGLAEGKSPGDMELLKALLDGLTLEKKMDYIDLINEYRPNWPRSVKFGVSMIGEIWGDPISYFNFFTTTKLGRKYLALRSNLLAGLDLTDDMQSTLSLLNRAGFSADDIKRGLSLAEQAHFGGRAVVASSMPFAPPGRAIVKGEPFWNLADTILGKLSQGPFYQYIWKQISTQPGIGAERELAAFHDDLKGASEGLKRMIGDEWSRSRKIIVQEAQKLNIPMDDMMGNISNALLYGGSHWDVLPESVRPIARRIQTAYETFLDREVMAGFRITRLKEMTEGKLGYTYQPVNPVILEAMGVRDTKAYRDFLANNTASMERLLREPAHVTNRIWTTPMDMLTKEEQAYKEFLHKVFKGIDPVKFPELVTVDPIEQVIRRSLIHTRSMTAHEWMSMVPAYGYHKPYGQVIGDIGDYEDVFDINRNISLAPTERIIPETRLPIGQRNVLYTSYQQQLAREVDSETYRKLLDGTFDGQKYRNLSRSHMQLLASTDPGNFEALRGVIFPENVARYIESVIDIQKDPGKWEDFLRYVQDFNSVWVKYTLGTPAWVVRNSASWMYFGYAAGYSLSDIDDTIRALSNEKALINTAKGFLTGADLKDGMRYTNTIHSGFYAQMMNMNQGTYASKLTRPMDPIFAMNTMGEDFFRAVGYIHHIKQGHVPHMAARLARWDMLETGRLTDVERTIRRTVVPFYGWERHNIPKQIELAIQNPAAFWTPEKMRTTVEKTSDISPEMRMFLPFEARMTGAFFTRPIEEGARTTLGFAWPLGADPTYDLLQFVNLLTTKEDWGGKGVPPALRQLFSSMGPIPKTLTMLAFVPGNQAIGQWGQVFNEEQMTNFLGMPMYRQYAEFLRQIPYLNYIDQLNPGQVFGNEETGEPSIWGYPRAFGTSVGEEEAMTKYLSAYREYQHDPIQSYHRMVSDAQREIQARESELTDVIGLYRNYLVLKRDAQLEGDDELARSIQKSLDGLIERRKEIEAAIDRQKMTIAYYMETMSTELSKYPGLGVPEYAPWRRQ